MLTICRDTFSRIEFLKSSSVGLGLQRVGFLCDMILNLILEDKVDGRPTEDLSPLILKSYVGLLGDEIHLALEALLDYSAHWPISSAANYHGRLPQPCRL